MKILTARQCSFKFALFALFSVALSFAQSAIAQTGAHRHENSGDVMHLVKDEIRIAEVKPAAKTVRENIVRNRLFEAFTVEDEKLGERIFFADRRSGKIYEITGVPLEWRPFSDLGWQGENTLIFDRWANPSFGAHYEIDAKLKRLKKAENFDGSSDR